MNFLESLLLTFFAHKATKEVVETAAATPRGSNHYTNLRKRFYRVGEIPPSVLTELFYMEPDLIDTGNGDDCREFLKIKVSRFRIGDKTFWEDSWFTISAKNRFIGVGIIDDMMEDNLRDMNLDDFSSKPFNPSANPSEHSITVEKYTFYFDRPFFYNLTILLLEYSDQRYFSGERVQQRAVVYPKIKMDTQDPLLVKAAEENTLILENAYYASLNDYNTEKSYYILKGRLDLRKDSSGIIVDSKKSVPSEYDCPIYLSTFLSDAESVNIRGNIETKELYVCRTDDGWGGIKFVVSSKDDFNRLACWLIVAIAQRCSVVRGWDVNEIIEEYWPSYPPLLLHKQDEMARDILDRFEIQKKVIYNEADKQLNLDLAYNIIVGHLSNIHHWVDDPDDTEYDFLMPTFYHFRETVKKTNLEACMHAFRESGINYDAEDLEIYEKNRSLFYGLFSMIVEASALPKGDKDDVVEKLLIQAEAPKDLLISEIEADADGTVMLQQYLSKAKTIDGGEAYISGLLDLLCFTCEKVIHQLQHEYMEASFENDPLQAISSRLQSLKV